MKPRTPFEIRSYGCSELAQAYFPASTPRAAWRQLRTWIFRFPGLAEKLGMHEPGKPHPRCLTPRQVMDIVEAIGPPYY